MPASHEEFTQQQARIMYAALETVAKQNLAATQAATVAQSALAMFDAPAIVKQGFYSMQAGEDGEYELIRAGRVVGVINFWDDAVRVMDGIGKRAGHVSPAQDGYNHEIMAKVDEYAQAACRGDDDLMRNIGYVLQQMLFVTPIIRASSPQAT